MLSKLGTKWVEINLDAIQNNLDAIRKQIGKRSIMAIVKADGYGHGAVEVAKLAEKSGVRMLGVSSIDEGIQLREAFIEKDILVLGASLESQACDIINYNLTASVCNMEFAEYLNTECGRLQRRIDVHLCVDTGMGRVGPGPEEAVPLAKQLLKLPNINLTGIYSHFSSADEDFSFSKGQLEAFRSVVKTLDTEGLVIPFRHLANSAGILELDDSYYDMVRAGLIMYGIYPYGNPKRGKGRLELEPALSLKTRVVFVKEVSKGTPVSYGRSYITNKTTRIATLPIGYADGFSRSFSNAGHVLIKGKRYTISGNVCMDMMMVDIGNDDVAINDEVVVIGTQGTEEINVYEMARTLKTIPYEIVSLIGKRIPRLYLRNKQPYSLKNLFRG